MKPTFLKSEKVSHRAQITSFRHHHLIQHTQISLSQPSVESDIPKIRLRVDNSTKQCVTMT